jgi:hypothetical protein
MFAGEKIPCHQDGGTWSDAKNCYVQKSGLPYAPTDPVWEGHFPDGAIYDCYNPYLIGTKYYAFWADTNPTLPDPRVLARQAIARMQLSAVSVGIVPEPLPGRVGIIGMPTWMWAQNPGPATWGPITRSAAAGGFTVTATAKVDKVVWDMGDGKSVTCRTPGTPYADRYGKKDSPDCGHKYTKKGRYTVTATSYWVVTWAGLGQTGTIPLQLSDTTTITMGEVQVLVQ